MTYDDNVMTIHGLTFFSLSIQIWMQLSTCSFSGRYQIVTKVLANNFSTYSLKVTANKLEFWAWHHIPNKLCLVKKVFWRFLNFLLNKKINSNLSPFLLHRVYFGHWFLFFILLYSNLNTMKHLYFFSILVMTY